MATEAEYDEIIAPMLAEVGAKARELGMNLVARVEWEPGEGGVTHTGLPEGTSVAQGITYLAAMCNGNVDLLFIEIAKRYENGSSIVMRQLKDEK